MKPRALIVDDDPEIAQAAGDILSSLNHDYDTADSVCAARNLAECHKYDYYLVDLQLPVQSGYGLARIQHGENLIDELIKQDVRRKQRIIVITAHGNDSPSQPVEMMKKGIADYIPKPFEETGKTLDKAIREMLSKAEGDSGTHNAFCPAELAPFNGGTIVFFPDRVELCGVDICSGPRSVSRRIVLELLSRRRNGAFLACSGDELAAEAIKRGAEGTAVGWIRDLRRAITKRLRDRKGILCNHEDVVRTDDRGYFLAGILAVEVPDSAISDITDTQASIDVRNDDVGNVRDDEGSGARLAWILQQLAQDRRLNAPEIADHFSCSLKTAERDLGFLKKQQKIEFVGSRRSGYYRLLQGTAPNHAVKRTSRARDAVSAEGE